MFLTVSLLCVCIRWLNAEQDLPSDRIRQERSCSTVNFPMAMWTLRPFMELVQCYPVKSTLQIYGFGTVSHI
jgi:hypothetical protein